jgi:molybdopterin-containing oxidoreductase family iron-sulfur binding subunit
VSNSLRDGRGANLPWLQELPDPLTSVVYGSWVEVNPQTAKRLKVREGDVVTVESPHGRLTAPVFVYQAIRPDVIAMPIGQGHTAYGRYAQNRGANPISILAPQEETVTGSLASHSTRIRLIPTGRRVKLVKTGGESRELGRNIVQTTADAGHDTNTSHRTNLNNIPITVESS